MGKTTEALRGLSTLGHLGLLLLIPILIGVFGGIWLDNRFLCSPVCTVVGAVIGIAAAFRNLYVWSVRQIARNDKSGRVREAMRESESERGQTE